MPLACVAPVGGDTIQILSWSLASEY